MVFNTCCMYHRKLYLSIKNTQYNSKCTNFGVKSVAKEPLFGRHTTEVETTKRKEVINLFHYCYDIVPVIKSTIK